MANRSSKGQIRAFPMHEDVRSRGHVFRQACELSYQRECTALDGFLIYMMARIVICSESSAVQAKCYRG